MPTLRKLRTRETEKIAIVPVAVTDRTCALVLGLDPEPFRALLVAENIPHRSVGRRVIARVDDVLSALTSTPRVALAAPSSTDEPATVDDVLAELGMKRAL